MGRVAAILGALLGLFLVPLALTGPTAWLCLPVHFAFALGVTAGAVGEGVAGHPERARVWGAGYIVVSIAMVGALELGSTVAQRSYWLFPWLVLLLWGWAPPVAAGLSGMLGEHIRLLRSNRAVKRRHRRAAKAKRKTAPS